MSIWTPSKPPGNKKNTTFNPLKNIVPAKPKAVKPSTPISADAAERRAAAGNKPVYGTPLPPPPPAYNPPSNNETNITDVVPDATPMMAAAPEITEDTLRNTTEYLARERALQAALSLFGETQNTDLARYGEGYKKNLTNLGWRGDINDWDYGQLISQGERATESGKAFKALADDFAARGMLQSGAYQGARNILQNQLNERRTALEEGQKNFAEDQQKARTAFLAEQEAARTQALADARAALLGQMGA